MIRRPPRSTLFPYTTLFRSTSEPFDCRGWEQVTCDKAQIDRQIDEMHRMGVRSSLLLNKFDNPLTGVRFDSGAASYLINAGNRQSRSEERRVGKECRSRWSPYH